MKSFYSIIKINFLNFSKITQLFIEKIVVYFLSWKFFWKTNKTITLNDFFCKEDQEYS